MTAHACPAFRWISACLLVGATAPVQAMGLGELTVDSSLGEPLNATVALETAPDAIPRADCFKLGQARAAGLPQISRATFAVEPDGRAWRLRIRTRAPVNEPALQLRLEASCDGRDAASRQYAILLDPRLARSPPAFRSLPGDTLSVLASAIYPDSPAAREAYLRALRDANPAVSGLPPDQPFPSGISIVLPDLRRFATSLAASPGASSPTPAPASATGTSAGPAPPARRSARTPAPTVPANPAGAKAPGDLKGETPRPVSAPEPDKPPTPASVPKPPPATTSTAQPGDGRFVLRLSSSEVDLSRSRGIDDRKRSQLRERLLVLDADDQVAALLSMRNSLKQLEGRVAELQLKLSALPANFPAATAGSARSAPIVAKAPDSPPAPAPAPMAEKPAEPEKIAALPASPSPAAITSPVESPLPASRPAAASLEPPSPAAPSSALPPPKPPSPATPSPTLPAGPDVSPWRDVPTPWLLGALAAVATLIAALLWRVTSRSRGTREHPVAPPSPAHASALDEADAMMRGGAEDLDREPTPETGREHRFVADSDANLATDVPVGDPAALRRRYIEERFPEIATGTISPAEQDSVVKAARLFYEDGAIARAIELLHFAVEENPSNLKPWLALFEIFRLERLAGPFADLASRFQEHHGESQNWLKVQHIGREIDPKNPIFQDRPFNSLETVAMPAPKGAQPVTFDPLAENWLNAPMDFTTVALAASLRAGLLADAGVAESDLVANPMPALKSIETFNVA